MVAKKQIEAQKKKLKKAKEAAAQAEQDGYDTGVKEIKENLRAQVTCVCQGYCFQVWIEALNQARVDVSSTLRRIEIPPPQALYIAGPSSSQADAAPKALKSSQATPTSTLPTPTVPFKEAEQAGTVEEELAKEKASEPIKLLLAKIPPRKRRQPSARYLY